MRRNAERELGILVSGSAYPPVLMILGGVRSCSETVVVLRGYVQCYAHPPLLLILMSARLTLWNNARLPFQRLLIYY